MDDIKPDDIKPEDKPLELKIKFTTETGIHVEAPGNGTFYNIPLCLFLLDSAKDFIKETNFMNSQSKIEKPGVINRIKKFTGGAFGGKR